MAETISLNIPDPIVQQAKQQASKTHQPFEDILLEWLTSSFIDQPIETLPDSQILALCEMQLDDQQQDRLNNLLSSQRETPLTTTDNQELTFLLKLYRRGLLRKAKALVIAVERGLIPPLSATA
jgi:hypothetical protein